MIKSLQDQSELGSNNAADGPECEEASPRFAGLVVPLHRILFEVGRGGTGTVYKAMHEVTERFVAVKVIDGPDNFEKFNTEAKLTRLLDHAGICKIYSYGRTDDGRLYLTMEWIEGVSLAGMMAKSQLVSQMAFCSIMRGIFDAVGYAHGKGVIHRDLKPANVMLVSDEATKSHHVKIIDFGLGRIAKTESDGQDTTRSEVLRGSPIYMSPEQCRQESGDQRVDIYAIGVMMYELITGGPPFIGAMALDVMFKHLHEEPPVMSLRSPGFAVYVPIVIITRSAAVCKHETLSGN